MGFGLVMRIAGTMRTASVCDSPPRPPAVGPSRPAPSADTVNPVSVARLRLVLLSDPTAKTKGKDFQKYVARGLCSGPFVQGGAVRSGAFGRIRYSVWVTILPTRF